MLRKRQRSRSTELSPTPGGGDLDPVAASNDASRTDAKAWMPAQVSVLPHFGELTDKHSKRARLLPSSPSSPHRLQALPFSFTDAQPRSSAAPCYHFSSSVSTPILPSPGSSHHPFGPITTSPSESTTANSGISASNSIYPLDTFALRLDSPRKQPVESIPLTTEDGLVGHAFMSDRDGRSTVDDGGGVDMGTVMDTGGQGCIGMDVDMEGDSKESGWIDGSHREGMTTSQTYPPFSHRTQAHVYHNHSQPHRPYRPGNNNNLSQAHSSTSSPGGSIGGGDSSRHRSHSLHKPSSPHKNISPPTAILKQRRTPNYDAEPYWIEGMMMDAGGEGAYMTPCHSPGSVGTTNSRRSVKSVRSGGGEGDVDMISPKTLSPASSAPSPKIGGKSSPRATSGLKARYTMGPRVDCERCQSGVRGHFGHWG